MRGGASGDGRRELVGAWRRPGLGGVRGGPEGLERGSHGGCPLWARPNIVAPGHSGRKAGRGVSVLWAEAPPGEVPGEAAGSPARGSRAHLEGPAPALEAALSRPCDRAWVRGIRRSEWATRWASPPPLRAALLGPSVRVPPERREGAPRRRGDPLGAHATGAGRGLLLDPSRPSARRPHLPGMGGLSRGEVRGAQQTTLSRMASWTAGPAATMLPPRSHSSPPWASVTSPPASRTSSAPAATSCGERCSSQ